MGVRKIIHLDLDAFFCAVEELRRPDLCGVPFAVGGRPDQRGVVASCSYAARQFGVHSAMPTSRALRVCPELVLISGHHTDYHAASEQVMDILRQKTPLIEQISIDEAFLDVSDLSQPGEQIARELQTEIDTRCGLPCSLGVATNKLVAKVATNIGKASHRGATPPRAILDVPPGEEAAFLAPLPIKELWGVGPKTAAQMVGFGIKTIGDLAKMPEDWLVRNFGKNGADFKLRAQGRDDRPVETSHEVKSISQEVTFDKDISDLIRLEETLRELSSQVGYRLRQSGFSASTVRLKLRWPDFSTHTRQITLQQSTDQDGVIFANVRQLFHTLWQRGKAVRLLGVGASGLSFQARQLSLWDTPNERERRLLQALDELRQRFGEEAVQHAVSLGKDKPGKHLPAKDTR